MKVFYLTLTLLATVLLSSLTALAQTQSREDRLNEIENKRKEIAELEKKLLAPSDEDRLRYADFLRLPDTGLIRLLPREKYDSTYGRTVTPKAPGAFPRKKAADLHNSSIPGAIVPGRAPTGGGTAPVQNDAAFTNLDDLPTVNGDSVKSTPITMRGGGGYYSFTRRTHEYGASDIQLDHGELQTGFSGVNYGLMTKLGKVPLEEVNLQITAVQGLAGYAPPAQASDARLEQSRFQQGAKIDSVKVKRSLPVQLNSTYLLRAINYAQSDVLVAFKVVTIDSDGSAVILWKLLQRFPTPQLARN